MVEKFDYNRMKSTAYRLIDRFGQSLDFTRETGETYDPSTGTTSSTTETYSADVVWGDYNKNEIDDTLVKQGDARLVVAGEVKVDDRVTFNNKEWRVIDVSPLTPGGVELYTEAQVRR